MTSVTTAQRMTAEEFMALPESPDARKHELVEGELVVTSPRLLHAHLQRALFLALADWDRAAGGRGEVVLAIDTRLDELNVFAPDLLWYREGGVPDVHDPAPYPLPDLAIEIRSPSTWRYDIGAKKAAYERHGVPELWLVDSAAKEVLVFRRSAPKVARFDVALELGVTEVLESSLLPGFRLAVADIYAE